MEIVIVDNFLNDIGTYSSEVALTGRTEVTILDNLRDVSISLHGRIVSTGTNCKVFISKRQLGHMINAYQGIIVYGVSKGLSGLLINLRSIYDNSVSDNEVILPQSTVIQIAECNDEIASGIGEVWDSVFSLRLLSGSGVNKDIAINGKSQTLSKMLKQTASENFDTVLGYCRRSGQLAGLRTVRQSEARDIISDLIFSRRGNSSTLNEIFTQTDIQRKDLKSFRTDVLFCPIDRYSDLQKGYVIRPFLEVKNEDNGGCVVTPKSFEMVTFVVKNLSSKIRTIKISGSRSNGVVKIHPLTTIQRGGTSLIFSPGDFEVCSIDVFANLTLTTRGGNSLAKLAMDGKLGSDEELSYWFDQICSPIKKYTFSIVEKLKTNQLLKIVGAAMGEWVGPVISNLDGSFLCDSWLSDSDIPERERIFYVYLLAMIVPELLLDPTLTYGSTTGTPPFHSDYVNFAKRFRALYE